MKIPVTISGENVYAQCRPVNAVLMVFMLRIMKREFCHVLLIKIDGPTFIRCFLRNLG